MAEMTWSPTREDAQAPPSLDSHDAVTRLFDQYADAIYNYCYRRTASWHEAEDLTAQVFLQAWQSRTRARPHEGTFAPWLYGIANNMCRAHLRTTQRRSGRLRAVGRELVGDPVPDPADRHADAERLRGALARVATLPADHQEVFFLICWEGLDYAACAAALNLPVGTVRSRLSRIRADLRLHDRNDHD